MYEENIVIRTSSGSNCLYCEKPISKGEPVIAIGVKLPVRLPIMNPRIDREIHVGCAKLFRELLDLRIQQAGG